MHRSSLPRRGGGLGWGRRRFSSTQSSSERTTPTPTLPQLGGGRSRQSPLMRYQLDLGSPSLISTVKLPSLIAFSFSATLATTSAGTLPSKVPSGDRLQPPA